MAEESSVGLESDTPFAQTDEIFRSLQGLASCEQYQEWKKIKEQTGGVSVEETEQEDVVSELSSSSSLLSPAVLDSMPALHTSIDEDGDAFPDLLPAATILGILETDKQDDAENREEEDENAMGLEDAIRRVTALAQTLQGTGESEGQTSDISAVAMQNPEVLSKYLTGSMSFEEFFKVVDEKRERSERPRKRKADSAYVYEDDDDFASDSEESVDSADNKESKCKKRKKDDDGLNPSVSGFKRKYKDRRRPYHVPPHLKGLMGAATHNVALGEYDEAIKMCSEIIRLAPRASEPYRTLSHICDEQGQTSKATEFLMIFAYMRRTDEETWLTLVNRLLQQSEPARAYQCLNQAYVFATEPSSKIKLGMYRSELWEQIGETNKALTGYSQVLSLMDSAHTSDDDYILLAHATCEKYYRQNKLTEAVKILTNMFNSRPSLINSEDVNRLLDLQLEMQQHQLCLEAMVSYCGVAITMDSHTDQRLPQGMTLPAHWTNDSPLPPGLDLKAVPDCVISVKVPDNIPGGFPLELLAKLCTCLINLGLTPQAQHLVEMLMRENVEEEGNGDRFLDVADAYMDTDQNDKALPILKRCVDSKNYSQAAVWLRYGECLSSVGELQEAIKAFSRVVEMAPTHLGARVSLSALQQQVGHHEAALQVLSAGGSGENILEDQRLLLHKCYLFLSQTRHADFIAASRRLLFSYINAGHNSLLLKIILHFRTSKHRRDAILDYMKKKPDQYDLCKVLPDHDTSTSKKDKSIGQKNNQAVTASDLWDIFVKLCDVLLQEGRKDELCEITILGMSHPVLIADSGKVKALEFMCVTACLMNRNGQAVYHLIRDLCTKQEPKRPMAWNLLAQCLLFPQELRHYKFCFRWLQQCPDHPCLEIFSGHNSIQSGSYRYALGEYVAVLRQAPTNPLLHLCVGLCYIHIACQKYTPKREWVILQGLAFLNSYLSLRGRCQESYYNIGRAFQQLDLGYAAIYYYKKALNLAAVVEGNDRVYELSKEIAFNMSLIYKRSGNNELARQCIQNFIVI